MNAGSLALGTLNVLGVSHHSFIIDVHPTRQAQFYAVVSARIDVTRPPYAYHAEAAEAGFATRVSSLVDVRFDFELSSTTLPIESGDHPTGPGEYERVGVHAVPFSWQATLALDSSGDLIGGRWNGEPADGPDNLAFVQGGPL